MLECDRVVPLPSRIGHREILDGWHIWCRGWYLQACNGRSLGRLLIAASIGEEPLLKRRDKFISTLVGSL